MDILFKVSSLLLWLLGSSVLGETRHLSKPEDICVAIENQKSPGVLYIGNQQSGAVPLLQFQISDIHSFESSFELRTFDPEGIIFHGNMRTEESWFLLSLHDRFLQIHLHEGSSLIRISSGRVINDGHWKRISVAIKNSFILVSVDNDDIIKVNHLRDITQFQEETGVLKIGIGALLPNISVPVHINPSLDGCLRNWDWVKQDSKVLYQTIESSESRKCWDTIVPGSYFPGSGFAEFESLFFHTNLSQAEVENWSLTVELSLTPVISNGVLFAVLDFQSNLSFSLCLNETQQLVALTIFGKTLESHGLPPNLCSGQSQEWCLTLANNTVSLKMAETEEKWIISEGEFQQLRETWEHPDSVIYLGGLPETMSASSTRTSYFHGCVHVKIQGKPIDMDMARKKHSDIRAHSCPAVALHVLENK
ncbi:vitamin K-dependent protein S-like [Polypterus senegalus]|uniref:vitamin K-dependent protein S-like n=1 Tax=Polypterus senegalus TaxID=55291 RepID=UPI0019653142|nr:vitamin K-dependent protein S-like [Polypterus senegalus]